MNENFYQDSNSGVVSTQVTASNSTGSWFGLNLELGNILHTLNYLVLAWTIVYSILFVWDFFYYRVKYNDYEVEREKQGVKSMNIALAMWYSYIMALLLFFFYTISPAFLAPFVGWVAVFGYLFKVFVADMPDIPVIGKFFGLPGNKWDELVKGIFDGAKNLVTEFTAYVGKMFGGSSS
jgi:hypothetical protein